MSSSVAPLPPALHLPMDALTAFCRKWGVARLELFGSALREDFAAESDVDLLVTFQPGSRYSLLDLARMENGLVDLLGRPVDLIDRAGLLQSRNALRREEILRTAITVYAA